MDGVRRKGEKWNPGYPDDSIGHQGGVYTTEDSSVTEYAAEALWESYVVTDLIKRFVAGVPNYGFIVINDHAPGHTCRCYVSSDFATNKSWRPKLTIKYDASTIKNPHTLSSQKGFQIIQTPDRLRLFIPVKGRYTLDLVDFSGKEIVSYTGSDIQWFQVPMRNFARGVYIIKISTANDIFTEKIIAIR